MSEISRRDRAPTLSHAATDELRELIIQGELRPNEHIQENRVCARLGISRTPARSALASLATEGYVVYHPNRGYFVRAFELADLREAWEIRSVLEGLAAKKCAEGGLATEDQFILANCLSQGDEILGRGSFGSAEVEPYRKMNMTFHETLLRASCMNTIAQAVKATQNMPFVSDRILVWQDFDHLRRSHDDHHRVFDAVTGRQGARAEYLMREHVYYAGVFVANHVAKSKSTFPQSLVAG
jgi:GntR family transcriptional regulator, vanillate catabolism transcriptional regulator